MFKFLVITLVIGLSWGCVKATDAEASTLIIPKMGLRAPIGDFLNNGPSWVHHIRPGDGMQVWIAGHRTTFSHPFYYLDRLKRGDKIYLIYHGKPIRYRVTRSVVHSANRIYETAETESLMLSACTPRGSASHRIVVYALPEK